MPVLIWIHTSGHIGRVPEKIFLKSEFGKKSAEAYKSMKNYPVCRVNEGMPNYYSNALANLCNRMSDSITS